MRVGLYVDGLNLYYGGRSHFGRRSPGWRWLDIRRLGERLIASRHDWVRQGAMLDRVVYCTTFIDGSENEEARRRQGAYVSALREYGSYDHLEEGRFVVRVRHGLLATKGANDRR